MFLNCIYINIKGIIKKNKMGNHAVCGCDDDPRLYNQECTIGSGNFDYKKMVCNEELIAY